MPAIGDPIMGKECKAYYNTGTHAIPVWVLIPKVKDLSIANAASEPDISVRGSKFKLSGQGLLDAGIEFGYLHVFGAETVRDALAASYFSNTIRQYAFMDTAIATAGARGLRAGMVCTQFARDEPLDGAAAYSVTLKPTYWESPVGTQVEPDWFVVP